MNDDRVVRLLEEIRDGQRALLEQYQQVVKNQEQSIAMQRSAMALIPLNSQSQRLRRPEEEPH